MTMRGQNHIKNETRNLYTIEMKNLNIWKANVWKTQINQTFTDVNINFSAPREGSNSILVLVAVMHLVIIPEG